jgi:DNA-directed RNA polymerase specialized sigma24 family protein
LAENKLVKTERRFIMAEVIGNWENENRREYLKWRNWENESPSDPDPSKPSFEKRVLSVVRYLCWLFECPQLAEDLTQYVLVKLFENDIFRGDASLETFVRVITRHELIRLGKKSRAHPLQAIPDTVHDKRPEEKIEQINNDIDNDKLLRDLLRKRPDLEQRAAAIILNATGKISRREVGRQLQKADPEITRYQIEKALDELGEALDKRRKAPLKPGR